MGEGDSYWFSWSFLLFHTVWAISEYKLFFGQYFPSSDTKKSLFVHFSHSARVYIRIKVKLVYSGQLRLLKKVFPITRCPLYRRFSVISEEVNSSKFACFWTILRPSSLKNNCETLNSGNSWSSWWSVRGVAEKERNA